MISGGQATLALSRGSTESRQIFCGFLCLCGLVAFVFYICEYEPRKNSAGYNRNC
jgi:hypothetical protein